MVVALDERGDRVHEVRESFRRSVWAGALHAVRGVSTIWPLVHLRGVEHGGVNWSLVSGTKGKRACRLLETLAHGCGSTNSPRLCLEETNVQYLVFSAPLDELAPKGDSVKPSTSWRRTIIGTSEEMLQRLVLS